MGRCAILRCDTQSQARLCVLPVVTHCHKYLYAMQCSRPMQPCAVYQQSYMLQSLSRYPMSVWRRSEFWNFLGYSRSLFLERARLRKHDSISFFLEKCCLDPHNGCFLLSATVERLSLDLALSLVIIMLATINACLMIFNSCTYDCHFVLSALCEVFSRVVSKVCSPWDSYVSRRQSCAYGTDTLEYSPRSR